MFNVEDIDIFIISLLSKPAKILASHCCKKWKNIVDNFLSKDSSAKRKQNYIISSYIAEYNGKQIEYFFEYYNIIIRPVHLVMATINRNLDALEKIHMLLKCDLFPALWLAAAKSGNIEIIDYLFDKKCPYSKYEIHQEITRSRSRSRNKYDKNQIMSELNIDEFECQVGHYLSLIIIYCGICPLTVAAAYSTVEIIEYIKNKNLYICDFTEREFGRKMLECAAYSGNIEVLKYLQKNNCAYYGMFTGIYVTSSRNFEAIKYVYENFPNDLNHNQNFKMVSVGGGNLDAVKFIYNHGGRHLFDYKEIWIIKGHYPDIDNWFKEIKYPCAYIYLDMEILQKMIDENK
jgi:hypothetical protein